jgi:hypothetical protein
MDIHGYELAYIRTRGHSSRVHNKQKSYKIMKLQMFAILDKANPDTEYKRLKLGRGHAYDRSSDLTAVVAGATNDRA